MTRILVIEDDEDVRNLLRDMLEEEGYDIVVAEDGHAGARIWREEAVDLVITDIFMPKKDGIEIIAELQLDYPDVKVVAISGGGRLDPDTYLASAELLGAISSLPKPFGRKELLREVRTALKE